MLLKQNKINNTQSFITSGDFITEKEYGKYLYQNPRGISCKSCHGEYGEGSLLATYIDRNQEKQLYAPNITNHTIQDFSKAVKYPKGVMPTYYLTDIEIQAIYQFITTQ
ncbi:cytochrome C oxidase subunit III [Helicobacter didelphidarum]|uniref:Cytochrome C oxidase subunit III n=1 Tax=Helicobacter didelphidarum TaxID=2040648 RepID=A0A3D8IPD9_9HELI|nr:cytochrome C oxidase subunit III [Helicobacter didelphidarum]